MREDTERDQDNGTTDTTETIETVKVEGKFEIILDIKKTHTSQFIR